jgi:hypothetical protein
MYDKSSRVFRRIVAALIYISVRYPRQIMNPPPVLAKSSSMLFILSIISVKDTFIKRRSKVDIHRHMSTALALFSMTILLGSISNIAGTIIPNQQQVSPAKEPFGTAYAQSSSDFNFGAAGDWACNSRTQATVENIVDRNPELVLGLGDYSYESSADCWFAAVDPIDNKMKISIGNHDDESTSKLNQYMNHFGLSKQYYSFNYQNVLFVVMSTELPYSRDSEQYNFVSSQLENAATNPDIDWIVVYYHKLAYTSPSDHSASSSLRDTYHALFDRYGVDLVLQAHNHNYQRSYPIRYNPDDPSNPIVTDTSATTYNDPSGQIYSTVGTAGASRHSLNGQPYYIATQSATIHGFLNIDVTNGGSTFSAKFYGNDGLTKDQFTITKSISSPPPSENCVTPRIQGVSANGDTGYPPQNTVDNNLNTRWSNQGLPSWIQYDLGTSQPICNVDISWYRGNLRVNTFTISASENGQIFETIFEGQSSGTTTAAEQYDVVDVNARYVRITVTGNTENNYASITEVRFNRGYSYEPYLTLTGSNYVDVSSSSSLQPSTFSVAAWFKTSKEYTSNAYIVNKGGYGSESVGKNMNYGIFLDPYEHIRAGFETKSGGDQFVTSPAEYNDGRWHYAVVTYDGMTIRLFIDGIQVGSKSTSGAIADNTGFQPLRIGANSLTLDGYFTGNADEVRVWNRALSSQEVANAYGGVFSTDGQVLYMPFSTSSPPPAATECTTGWKVTGYYRPVESDFNSGQTTTVQTDDGKTRTFDSEFLSSVKRNGSGRTNEGLILKYFDGQWVIREFSAAWDGTPAEIGDIATDQNLIPTGTRGIVVSTLPAPWDLQTFKASDTGPAITGKHIDVFTGEGSIAQAETRRITAEDKTLCMPPLSLNDPPTAVYRDSFVLKTGVNDPISITIRATDPEGDPARFSIVRSPSSGTLGTITGYTTTVNQDTGIATTSAKVTYTPNSGFSGKDSFQYRADDGKEVGPIAIVSITVG